MSELILAFQLSLVRRMEFSTYALGRPRMSGSIDSAA